jgi:hypothetical protein
MGVARAEDADWTLRWEVSPILGDEPRWLFGAFTSGDEEVGPGGFGGSQRHPVSEHGTATGTPGPKLCRSGEGLRPVSPYVTNVFARYQTKYRDLGSLRWPAKRR